jgi:hypothetical protein
VVELRSRTVAAEPGPARRLQGWLADLTSEIGEARWSARRTLGFILVVCAAAWAAIFATIWFVFLRR